MEIIISYEMSILFALCKMLKYIIHLIEAITDVNRVKYNYVNYASNYVEILFCNRTQPSLNCRNNMYVQYCKSLTRNMRGSKANSVKLVKLISDIFI